MLDVKYTIILFQGGFYLFKLVDEYVASYPLLVVGFCELGAVIWYGKFNPSKHETLV